MSFTLLLLGCVLFLVILALTFIYMTLKKGVYLKRPYLHSFIIMSLFFGHWILYLTNFYSLLPEYISNFIFLPIWYFLCILGFIVFIREWKNNRIVSISIGVLSFISLLFGLLLLGISNM
ncbi:hypothetical protein D0U04_03480 [Bacillus clarus]|uniref:Putative membrane protein n=1 Tax=Bacillus clarus TaxID=2338372 RepID=A0A090Z1N5_9BACI|nr:hypothetical protein [Bacillus clarus]KFN04288.1 putative membrane protein [Bacillus clarus]RFT68523.1 hypothetical protein D0U04_03480 [Bacillus clarus]